MPVHSSLCQGNWLSGAFSGIAGQPSVGHFVGLSDHRCTAEGEARDIRTISGITWCPYFRKDL